MVAEDLHDHFSANMRALVHEQCKPQFAALSAPEPGTDTCKACVEGSTKFVMERSMGKMKEMCEKADAHSCVASKICGFMGKHPKMAFGMVMEHVRPVSLGLAYCHGKKACGEHDMDEMAAAEIFTGSQPHDMMLDTLDKVDWSDVETEAEPSTEDEAVAEAPSDEQCKKEMTMHHKVCPHCMKKTMRDVMGFAIKKVKGMCAQSSQDGGCPTLQRVCRFAKENKEVALGMLVAKVEPWKFAMGRCFHKGGHHSRFERAMFRMKHAAQKVQELFQV
jgi:hypothetical protein